MMENHIFLALFIKKIMELVLDLVYLMKMTLSLDLCEEKTHS